MSKDPSNKSDLLVLAHVAVVVVALAIALNLMSSCQTKTSDEKVPEPHPDLVLAMKDYCRVGDLPRDKWLEAQRAWGFQNGGNKNVMVMWNRAARDKHPVAIKVVRRAADLALGADKCPILDILDHPERVLPKSAPNQPVPSGGSAANEPAPSGGSAGANAPAPSGGSNAPAPSGGSAANQPAPAADGSAGSAAQ